MFRMERKDTKEAVYNLENLTTFIEHIKESNLQSLQFLLVGTENGTSYSGKHPGRMIETNIWGGFKRTDSGAYLDLDFYP